MLVEEKSKSLFDVSRHLISKTKLRPADKCLQTFVYKYRTQNICSPNFYFLFIQTRRLDQGSK